jgi:hypothetical protein
MPLGTRDDDDQVELDRGHKGTFRITNAMSALPPKADIACARLGMQPFCIISNV